MNKSDLVKSLAKEMDLPMRKAEEIVDMVFKTMTTALVAGNRIEIRGFGSFVVKKYEGYTGRNPKTGEDYRPDQTPAFLQDRQRTQGENKRIRQGAAGLSPGRDA